MSEVPASRYRVIERDRRLFVIDTWADGGRPTPSMPSASSASPPSSPPSGPVRLSLPKQIRFDGAAELTTHAFYDDRAPRTIKLDAVSMETIGKIKFGALIAAFVFTVMAIMEPWILLAPVLLFNTALRKGVRKAITLWLDRVEREAAQR
jgi:hypothetical protein